MWARWLTSWSRPGWRGRGIPPHMRPYLADLYDELWPKYETLGHAEDGWPPPIRRNLKNFQSTGVAALDPGAPSQ